MPDYLDDDSDGDGLFDGEEAGFTEEEPRDTDADGDYDFADTDADGDSLPDWDEIHVRAMRTTRTLTATATPMGVRWLQERTPQIRATSPDGIYVEVPERTGIESNFEFDLRIQMGDVAFLLDTTGSMGGTANAMASEFSAIVTALNALIPTPNTASRPTMTTPT